MAGIECNCMAAVQGGLYIIYLKNERTSQAYGATEIDPASTAIQASVLSITLHSPKLTNP